MEGAEEASFVTASEVFYVHKIIATRNTRHIEGQVVGIR
jgi:hypothetical protein